MTPTIALRESIGTLVAADTTLLAPAANANEISLVKADFVENENLTTAGLTLADFDGSTALSAGVGTQESGFDPITNEQLITILEPAGGWRWATTGVTNLPQTIYGYALTKKTAGALLGIHRFDTPITLTKVGQEINLGTAALRVVLQPMS